MFRRSALAVLALALVLSAVPARAGEPPAAPVLRPDPGMHTATIRRIAADASTRFLATASDDKTVRIWSLADGALLSVLRPPIGPGPEGMVYAVALSPDGETVACGGWTGWDWDGTASVYLFDRRSGRLERRLAGLPNVVNHLAFSPDGARLGAALGGKSGIRVWDTATWKLAGQDQDYGDHSYGLAFDSSGRLAATCYDGLVRLYDASLRLLSKVRAPGGKKPFAVAWSPDSARLAVGFSDTTAVNVLSGQDLSLEYAPDTAGLGNGNLYSVAWARDGRTLYAGGRYDQGGPNPVLQWPDAGRGPRAVLHADRITDTILGLQPLATGELAVGAGDPAWAVLGPDGRPRLFQGPPIADFRDNWEGFGVAAGGMAVGFGFKPRDRDPAMFDLAARALRPGPGKGLAAPVTRAPGLDVADWKNTYHPSLNNKPLDLKQYERSFSLALLPDKSGLILGTEWYVRRFDRAGREAWKVVAPGAAWAVNVTPDGRLALAALADGTIRWYRAADGRELLALYPHPDQKRWVAWTPEGYYDASPGAEDFIGWHVNRGKDQAADFFPVGQFRDRFYQPRVVAEVLRTLDADQALRLAQARPAAGLVTRALPPVVAILSPEEGAGHSGGEVEIRFSVRSDEPVTEVKLLLDGSPVATRRGLSVQAKAGGAERVERLALPGRDVTVGVLAVNRHGASQPAAVRLKWAGQAPAQEFSIRPRLYVLAVGVSDYADDSLDLTYAAKDARDFAAAAQAMGQGLYREVVAKTVTDAQATRAGVLKGLAWLSAQTTQHDVAMLFLAGHGENAPDGTYYFQPHDADPEAVTVNGVIFAEIKRTVENLAGKRVVFVDTCHAGSVMGAARRGGVDINAVVNELSGAESGAVVFSSSTGRQFSLEKPAWGNGAFTKALVEGMSGRAAVGGSGRITVNMLDLYVSERVKELTNGAQTPTTTKPPNTPDFPIAVRP